MNIIECILIKIVYFDYAIIDIFISWSTSMSFLSLKISYTYALHT